MKRTYVILLAAIILSLAACSGKDKESAEASAGTPAETSAEASTEASDPAQSESMVQARDYYVNDPAAVLDEITNDFSDVTAQLNEKLTGTFASVGTTFEDYQNNKGLVEEWINLVLSETDSLFARTKENSVAYFKLIAADDDHKYSEFCDEALDEYYDAVYDRALDKYYDKIYDDAMDDLYDEYYDGILDDAYRDVKYDEWSKARSECYGQWSDARSSLYRKWSDERSYIYGLWSVIRSAFCYNDDFDVDGIVSEYDKQKEEEYLKRAEEEAKVWVDFEAVYEINADGDAEVTGFTGEGNQVTISSEYEGNDVVRIADSAFEGCTQLERITMWADIEEIGNSAFKDCTGLTEFSIPNETKFIGHHAFEGCSNLEELIIWGDPDIGEYAFADCTSLTDISIGNDTVNVGAHAFDGCTGMESLIIWGADVIGDYAFAGCTGIEDVSIPSDVLSVGNHAFDGCTALSSVIVWGNDTAIGEDAFENCPDLDDAPSARGTVLECAFSGTGSGADNSGNEMDGNAETALNETAEAAQNDETDAAMDDKNSDESTGETGSGDDAEDIRPEFKEAMDSYEAVYTEYVEFMKKYKENPKDMSLLLKYPDMLEKVQEMDKAFKAWDQESLSAAELKYYLEVNNRVMKMLVDIVG